MTGHHNSIRNPYHLAFLRVLSTESQSIECQISSPIDHRSMRQWRVLLNVFIVMQSSESIL